MLCPVRGLAYDTSVRPSVVARIAVAMVHIVTVAFGDTTLALGESICLVTRCAVLLRLLRRMELVVFVSVVARHELSQHLPLHLHFALPHFLHFISTSPC